MYIKVGNQKVEVSDEVIKFQDRMINRTYHEARKIRACSCPSYRQCRGECAACRWQTEGAFISYDNESVGSCISSARDAYLFNPAANPRDPFEIVAERELFENACRRAGEICEKGDVILRMNYEKYSTHEIADAIGVPQKTVYRRLQRILADLRDNREWL